MKRRIFEPDDTPIVWAVWMGDDDDGQWLGNLDGHGGVVVWDATERGGGERAAEENWGKLVPYITMGLVMEALAGSLSANIDRAPKALQGLLRNRLGRLK